MSELYKHSLSKGVLKAAVQGIIDNSQKFEQPLEELIAEQIADAFENGLRVGLNLRCNEVVEDVPKVEKDHDVLAVIRHIDGCLIAAQQVMFNVIPGVIELPELIADYAHKSFAAGFDKGYEEGWTDGLKDGEEPDEQTA